MKVQEIVNRLSETQIDEINACPVWRFSETETWPDVMLSRSGSELAWSALSKQASIALEVVLCAFGPLPFSEEQLLLAARSGVAGSELRCGLLRLMEAGIVFAVRKGWGEKQYLLPHDLYLTWYEAMISLQHKRMSDIVPVPNEIDSRHIVSMDMEENGYTPPLSLQCVHVMAELVNTGMKRTSKGVLTKRAILKCTEQLAVDSNHLNAVAELSLAAPGEPYPLQLAFFLDIAYENQWLCELQGTYAIQEDRWNNWLESDPMRRETELLAQIIRLYLERSPSAASGIASLCMLPRNKWFRIADLDTQHLLRQDSLSKRQPSAITAWSSLLCALGWMEAAIDEQGGSVIRWLIPPNASMNGDDSYVGQTGQDGLLQITPDGDVYVPGDSSYQTIWQLERLVTRKRTDYTAVYRLDARSFKQDELLHATQEGVINFLESASGEALPETVQAIIVQAVTATSGRPANSPIEEAIPLEINEYIEPLPLIQNGNVVQTYELLTEKQPLKAMFVGIEDVPSMWLKQFRAYHSSTRRELMELALSWRTPVKLSCEGAVKPFVPERIVDEDGGWSVMGHFVLEESYAPAKLMPEMWQEMMLVLPTEIGSF
ncbi:hypothetical protein [Paenibacillus sp. CF384]|uniref:hypothetical protein n=1 Tax=Paenibacillus sp. CF384 TaxID=1884382 RepID=UPI00089BBD78|nr:hypothetical protein [Paenibacillus sp. CF384]SDW59060.1 hypothetical protein SAMN05518855_1003217 [Paenibacillus sp. CF384]